MIRKSALFCALALSVVAAAGVSAQKIEGTYEFTQKVMTAPDAAPVDAVAKLVLAVKGDSVSGTWTLTVPGREPKPIPLHGTFKGATLTLTSDAQQAKLSSPGGGDERTIDIVQQYVLTVSGDEITGEVTYMPSDENIQMPARSIKGKRAA